MPQAQSARLRAFRPVVRRAHRNAGGIDRIPERREKAQKGKEQEAEREVKRQKELFPQQVR